MMLKLIAFDLDGTLIPEKSSWYKIHEFFGTIDAALEHLHAYEEGRIDYDEFVRLDIESWPRHIHISVLDKIFRDVKPVAEARMVIENLQGKNLIIAVVSGGVDILANRISSELNIKHVVANGFRLTSQGFLTGEGTVRVDPKNKHLALKNLASNLRVKLSETVAVGDGRLDATFLATAGIGIAVGDNPQLKLIANYNVENLKGVLAIIEQLVG